MEYCRLQYKNRIDCHPGLSHWTGILDIKYMIGHSIRGNRFFYCHHILGT